MSTKYYFAGVLSVLLVFAIAIGGFLLGRSGTSKSNTTPTPTTGTSLQAPNSIQEKDAVPTPQEGVTTIIVSAAIVNQDYLALESFITNPVIMRIENSGCCQPMSPEEAVLQLEYLDNATGTWDFDESNEIVNNLQSSYPEHYANAIVGVSSDNYVVAFQLNTEGEIAKISMAVDYELLLP